MTVKQRKKQLQERKAWFALISFSVLTIGICAYGESLRTPVEPEDVMIEEYEDIIRFRQEDVEVELEDVTIEPTNKEKVECSPLESLGTFKVTAYCPCKSCSSDYGTQTSTGAVATEGRTVAVDPDVIPYGTVLLINIDGQWREYVAEDCGAAVKGKIIDIYFDTHEETENFRQYVEVYVRHQEGEYGSNR